MSEQFDRSQVITALIECVQPDDREKLNDLNDEQLAQLMGRVSDSPTGGDPPVDARDNNPKGNMETAIRGYASRGNGRLDGMRVFFNRMSLRVDAIAGFLGERFSSEFAEDYARGGVHKSFGAPAALALEVGERLSYVLQLVPVHVPFIDRDMPIGAFTVGGAIIYTICSRQHIGDVIGDYRENSRAKLGLTGLSLIAIDVSNGSPITSAAGHLAGQTIQNLMTYYGNMIG